MATSTFNNGNTNAVTKSSALRRQYASFFRFISSMFVLLTVVANLTTISLCRGDQNVKDETCSVPSSETHADEQNRPRTSDSTCFDDDENQCRNRPHSDCDDDEWMLLHCRKTCTICLPERDDQYGVTQNVGLGQVPLDVSVQILRVVRQTNLRHLSQKTPNTAVSLHTCRDGNEMCAFWAFQGQCHSPEFKVRAFFRDSVLSTLVLCIVHLMSPVYMSCDLI
jgi:hypothetical protein